MAKKMKSDAQFSNNRVSRVIVQKLEGVCGSALEDQFNKSYGVFLPICNEFISWGQDTVDMRQGPKIIEKDLKSERQEIYKKYTDGSITEDQFDLLLSNLFTIMMSDSDWRKFGTLIFGGSKKTDKLKSMSVLSKDYSQTIKNWASSKQLKELEDIKSEEELEDIKSEEEPEKIKEQAEIDLKKSQDKMRKKKEERLAFCILNTLKEIGFFNRFPFNTKQKESESGYLSADDTYIVLGNIARIMDGWAKCDKRARENYYQEETEIERAVSGLDEKDRTVLSGFFDFCRLEQDDGTVVLRHFDGRVRSHLINNVIPTFRSGTKEITKYFFIDRKNRKRKYSLHHSFYDYLWDHPKLWEKGDIEKCLVAKNLWILELIMLHANHRPSACFPFSSEEDKHRFQYYCGDNFAKYKFEADGEDIEDAIAIDYKGKKAPVFSFINGKKCDRLYIKIGEERFPVCIKKQYYSNGGEKTYGPNSYFKNLSVWSGSAKKTSYWFEFEKRGQRFKAIVKEPSIVFTNGEFCVRINQTINVDIKDKIDQEAFVYGISAHPARQNERKGLSESAKNQERLELCRGSIQRVLGIDLGVIRPYAYACVEWKVGEDPKFSIVAEGMCEKSPETSSLNEYLEFNRDIRVIRSIIGITRSIANKEEDEEEDEIELDKFQSEAICRVQKRLAKESESYAKSSDKNLQIKKKIWSEFAKMNIEEVIDSIRKVIKECDNDLKKVKCHANWVGTMMLKYLSLRFGEIKNRRKLYFNGSSDFVGKIDDEFLWIRGVVDLKSVRKSISFLGCAEEEKPELLFGEMEKYIRGCKDNLLKQIAASIVRKALELKCNIIILERLDGHSLDLKKAKKENDLLAMWSPKKISDSIKNAAAWHGLMVGSVSESCTSKVHFETEAFGYRAGRTFYYEDDDGEIQSVDADINAAKNIAHRFVFRHSDLKQICIIDLMKKKLKKEKKSKEDDKVKKDEESEKVVAFINKSRDGFLTKHFGSLDAANKFFTENFDTKVNYVYLHKGKWISDKKLKEIEERIKESISKVS